jgi:putative transposase
MALGPGVPGPSNHLRTLSLDHSRHQLGEHLAVRVKSVLGGLHHEYSLVHVPA